MSQYQQEAEWYTVVPEPGPASRLLARPSRSATRAERRASQQKGCARPQRPPGGRKSGPSSCSDTCGRWSRAGLQDLQGPRTQEISAVCPGPSWLGTSRRAVCLCQMLDCGVSINLQVQQAQQAPRGRHRCNVIRYMDLTKM